MFIKKLKVMKLLIVLFLYVLMQASQAVPSTHINPNQHYTYGERYYQSKHYDPFQCTRRGLACSDCQTPVVCVDLGEETWDKIETTTCSTKPRTSCLHGTCVFGPNPVCDGTVNLPFPCNAVGMFPDPFYCDHYHFCMPPQPYRRMAAICEPGYVYNLTTTFCEEISHTTKILKCDPGAGAFPVPLCKTPGQSGPLDNEVMYYVCKDYYERLYPFLYKCPGGLTYSNYKCG